MVFLPFCLMVLVSVRPLDVLPRSRLVTLITLVDLGRLTSVGLKRLKTHLHVMARRCLMALGQSMEFGEGCRNWGSSTSSSRGTGRVLTEEFVVPVLAGVAGRAIQDRLLRGKARMAFRPVARGLVSADPVEEVFPHPFVFTVWRVVGFQLAEADPGQRQVVHVGRTLVDSPMLDVAFAATADVGVERGRLALQQ